MALAEIDKGGRDIVARGVEEIPPIDLYDNPEVLVRFVPDSADGGVARLCPSTTNFCMASS